MSESARWPAISHEARKDTVNEIIQDLYAAMEAGQKEYARTDNVFANFNRVANELGLNPEQVLMVFAMKHMDGIIAWVDGHKSQREDVRGRIKDLIVYMMILWAMADAYDNGQYSINPTGLE